MVPVSAARFRRAGLIYNRIDGATAEFWFVDRPERVRVAVKAGRLNFAPHRSAGQRDVLAALGAPYEPSKA